MSDRQPLLSGFNEPEEDKKQPEAKQPEAAAETHDESAKTDGSADSAETRKSQQPATEKLEPVESLSGRRIYVIDAFSLIYQLYFAMPNLTGPKGQPVGALQGFVRDMLDLMSRREASEQWKQPTDIVVAFDAPGDVFRHEIYPSYKDNRDPMPDELRSQIEPIKQMLDAMAIPRLELVGYEADDIMATVATQVDQMDGECFIVTSDKDCRQLITNNVCMYNIRKDQYYIAENLLDDWGIRPDQVVDFQSLVGDSVDSVPGVPQIGPKTATGLLQEFETLEGVLDNAETVKAKNRRENLMNGRDMAMMSRELVRLDRSVPVEINWHAATIGGMDFERLNVLSDEFGFNRLKKRLMEMDLDAEPPPAWEADYVLVSDTDQLRELVAEISNQPLLSIDTETTGLNPRTADLVGISLAWETGKAYYVPVRALDGDPVLSLEDVTAILGPILESPSIAKLGQNIKYDLVVLRNHGIRVGGVRFDTMIADYLLEPGQRNHSLDAMSQRYLNHTMVPITELIGKGKKQITLDQVELDRVAYYAAEDADVPLRLYEILNPLLDESPQLRELFDSVEIPLIEVLAEMEFNGIQVNTKLLETMSQEFGTQLESLTASIHEQAGEEFNIDSPKQLSVILFEKMGLPVIKKTKTGASTDAEVLGELAKLGRSDLPELVIRYRQVAKLKSTYVDALPQLVSEKTLRVHTAFHQDVAATGRLSSADPNLQNIPVRTEEGRKIRSAFIAPESDWKLLAADYSQIELRVLAHFARDAALQQAFADDLDIHAQVASEVYDVNLEDVTSDMRRSAKAINFGVIYGQSAFGLAKSLGIDQQDAAEFIESYFTQYPGVEGFMDDTLRDCRKNGYVSTILGRRRLVTDVRDQDSLKNKRQRNLSERIAINTVIQGSAADLIKIAMINVLKQLQTGNWTARLLLQIHDELIFECPEDEIADLQEMVVHEMESAAELEVPLKVDVKTGPNWADCEPV